MTEKKTLKPGWRRVKFGDVVRLSKTRSQDPLADGIERYVGLEHLEPGDLRIRSWGSVADGVTFTSVFQSGQVLFGKRRAYQRKVAVADFSGVCSGDIYVMESKDAEVLQPELLPFICQTDAFFDHAVGTSAGSLSPRTNWKSLAEFDFSLPPIEQQGQLVDLLKTLHIAIDSYSDLAIATDRLLESSRDEAFVGPCVNRVTLGSLGSIRYGVGQPPPQINNGVPMIRATNIDRGRITSKDLMLVDLNQISPSRRIILKEGDILVVRSGAYTGDSAIINKQWEGSIAGYDLVVSVDRGKIDPRYVAEYLLARRTVVSVLTSLSARTAQPHLNAEDLSGVLIPIVNKEDQENLVQRWLKLKETIKISLQRKADILKIKNSLISYTWGHE
jgi:type I restriction enzyme, S subunit